MRIASITDGYPPPAMRPLSTITKLRMGIPLDYIVARVCRSIAPLSSFSRCGAISFLAPMAGPSCPPHIRFWFYRRN